MSNSESIKKSGSARELLIAWANSQENWVRGIVREVMVARQLPSNEALDEAYKTLLSEKGLSDEPTTAVPSLSLGDEDEEQAEALRLTALKNVENVNRLASEQEILFNPRLSVLFGENATGKSGYVRILKRVAAVRSAEEILPDIHKKAASGRPKALLEFELDEAPDFVNWQGESGLRPFTRMSIFDSRAVSFHLDGDLTYRYTPRDLALFENVSEALGSISGRLDEARKNAELGENTFLSRFQPGSVVYPRIETLSAATDLGALEALANVSDEEAGILGSYRDAVEALNPTLLASRLELARGDSTLLAKIRDTTTLISEFDVTSYNAAVDALAEAQERQRAATETAFAGFEIPGALSDAWRGFVSAGDAFLKDLELEEYPKEGDACLYCRQGLGASAVTLLKQYHDFCNNTLKADVDAARLGLAVIAATLDVVNLKSIEQGVLAKLQVDEGEVPPVPYAHTGGLLLTAPALLEAVRTGQRVVSNSVVTTANTLKSTAQTTLDSTDATIVTLQEQRAAREVARADAEKTVRDLEDRIALKIVLPAIRTAVESAKWGALAKTIVSKRFPPLKRTLTEQSKIASEDLINTGFETLFRKECKALKAPLVELQFPGKRGAAAARRKSLPQDHQLSDVLSEGEQKVIAISDFLAESAIRPSSAPILFDDPVTSFDHKRIDYIVDRLYSLSGTHQVIVFTHNIWFTSLLLAEFEDAKSAAGYSFYSIDVGPGEKPGYISKDNHPRLDTPKHIRTRLNRTIEDADPAVGATRTALIVTGYGHLRAWCEAVSEQDLLKGLSQRYRANIMMGKLKEIRADRLPAAAEVVTRIFDRACGIIEGHAMATATAGTSPSLQDLRDNWAEAQAALKAYNQ